MSSRGFIPTPPPFGVDVTELVGIASSTPAVASCNEIRRDPISVPGFSSFLVFFSRCNFFFFFVFFFVVTEVDPRLLTWVTVPVADRLRDAISTTFWRIAEAARVSPVLSFAAGAMSLRSPRPSSPFSSSSSSPLEDMYLSEHGDVSLSGVVHEKSTMFFSSSPSSF